MFSGGRGGWILGMGDGDGDVFMIGSRFVVGDGWIFPNPSLNPNPSGLINFCSFQFFFFSDLGVFVEY